jgi:hypothetical protein
MTTGCERVVNAAKQALRPERNRLGPRIIEACECLRWWWRNGAITGHPVAKPKATRVQIEADLVNALLGDAALSDEDEGLD